MGGVCDTQRDGVARVGGAVAAVGSPFPDVGWPPCVQGTQGSTGRPSLLPREGCRSQPGARLPAAAKGRWSGALRAWSGLSRVRHMLQRGNKSIHHRDKCHFNARNRASKGT